MFICAAGNSGVDLSTEPLYPAAFNLPNTITAAAIDNKGDLASFSNYGSKVDIAAPGVNILSTIPTNGYALTSGTSSAAAYVTGTAALLLSCDTNLLSQSIKEKILQNTEPLSQLSGRVNTGGMVNAYKVLSAQLQDPLVSITAPDNGTSVNLNQSATVYATGVNCHHMKVFIKEPGVTDYVYRDDSYIIGNSLEYSFIPDQTGTYGIKVKGYDMGDEEDPKIKVSEDIVLIEVSEALPQTKPATTITANYTLMEDEAYESLTISAGTVNLNGFNLYVFGDLIQAGGVLNINNGTLDIAGDYKIQSTSGSYSNGTLKMTGTSDKVIVGGSFITDSIADHRQYLAAGVLEVKGSFTQKSSAGYYSAYNFVASGTHKVLLSGASLQIISFDDYATSSFNILEKASIDAGISCITPISISSLQSDFMVEGDLVIGGNTDLSGKTMRIDGNLIHTRGILNINNGTLDITGDYKIQSTSGSCSIGALQMTEAQDRVIVGSSFITDSTVNHSQYLTSGILEVKGDFTQKSSGGYYSAYNFVASGTHKVLLTGSSLQTISFDDFATSTFNTLEVINNDMGISCSTPIAIRNLQNDLTIKGDLIIGGNTDLSGKTMRIDGSLIHQRGTLNINNGTLDITGDYKIQSISGDYSTGVLKMNAALDKVTVGGSFVTDSSINHNQYLTSGVLEVKGDFTQKSTYGAGGPYNFTASGTHKVLLSGSSLQTVSFEDYTRSKFNKLIITKQLDTGYSFNYQPVWVSLINMEDDVEAPTVPAGLTVTSKNDSSVSLSWPHSTDNIVVSGYEVFRDGSLIGETFYNTFTDTELFPGTTYTYEVRAIDGNGNTSELSDPIAVATDEGIGIEKPDWYYTDYVDSNGDTIKVYLSDLGSNEDESSDVTAIVAVNDQIQGEVYSLIGGEWIDQQYYAYLPDYSGVIAASVAEDVYSQDSTPPLTTMAINVFAIDFSQLKNDIQNISLEQLALEVTDFEPEEVEMYALGIAAGIDDNYFFSLFQHFDKIETHYDDYHFVTAKILIDSGSTVFWAAMTADAAASAAAAYATAAAAATGGALCAATGIGAPVGAAMEAGAIAVVAEGAICSVVSVVAANAAVKSKGFLEYSQGRLGGTTNHSKKLRDNLVDSGQTDPGSDYAAHHIVASGAENAAEAREILKRSDINIDIDDAVNGVFLPRKREISNASYHPEIHTRVFLPRINVQELLILRDRLKV